MKMHIFKQYCGVLPYVKPAEQVTFLCHPFTLIVLSNKL